MEPLPKGPTQAPRSTVLQAKQRDSPPAKCIVSASGIRHDRCIGVWYQLHFWIKTFIVGPCATFWSLVSSTCSDHLEERTFGYFQRLHRLIPYQTSKLSANLPSFLLFGIAFGGLSIVFHNVPRYHPGRRLPVEISSQPIVTEQSWSYTPTARTSHCIQFLRHVATATTVNCWGFLQHPSLGCGLWRWCTTTHSVKLTSTSAQPHLYHWTFAISAMQHSKSAIAPSYPPK